MAKNTFTPDLLEQHFTKNEWKKGTRLFQAKAVKSCALDGETIRGVVSSERANQSSYLTRLVFEGNYGDIITIGLRSVRMRTLNDDIITIPNNKFLNEVTTSGNYGALDMQVVIPFYVGMDEDITLARDLIQEAASSSRYIHLPKPVTVLVKQTITDNYLAIQLTCKAYVVDTAYEKLFETDITLRVMKEFRKHNINPPKISVTAH